MPDLVDQIPALKAIPAGRHRLLAEIMLIAWMSVATDKDGGNLEMRTAFFLDWLRDDGFQVKVTGKQIVITVKR